MNKAFMRLLTLNLALALLLFANSSKAQVKAITNSFETSLDLGLGGAIFGLQAKANHHWKEYEHLTIMSGLSINTYWSSVENYTQYFPELNALTDITGFNTDNHLRVYSGLRWALFKSKKLMLSTEVYFGAYHAYMRGNQYHERLQINQDYVASQLFLDYGTRFAIGYQVTEKLSVQATLNNSLRQLGYGYRLLPMIYQFNPDNKIGLGIGLVWGF
ncbi:MAG: hypothetical protein JXQ87_16430 [Bacteroidia bacterium]